MFRDTKGVYDLPGLSSPGVHTPVLLTFRGGFAEIADAITRVNTVRYADDEVLRANVEPAIRPDLSVNCLHYDIYIYIYICTPGSHNIL